MIWRHGLLLPLLEVVYVFRTTWRGAGCRGFHHQFLVTNNPDKVKWTSSHRTKTARKMLRTIKSEQRSPNNMKNENEFVCLPGWPLESVDQKFVTRFYTKLSSSEIRTNVRIGPEEHISVPAPFPSSVTESPYEWRPTPLSSSPILHSEDKRRIWFFGSTADSFHLNQPWSPKLKVMLVSWQSFFCSYGESHVGGKTECYFCISRISVLARPWRQGVDPYAAKPLLSWFAPP